MKHYMLSCIITVCTTFSIAQTPFKSPPPGGNKKAMVGEQIGITDVKINYDRPGVKGREGHIYGTPVVHNGYINLAEDGGTAVTAPWRAGANENTTIEFSTAVKVESKELAAGKYGFFVAYGADECTVIFSKDNASWGSYFYDEKHDALRVKVKPAKLDKAVEWLKYEFMDQTNNSATIALQWEKVMIPFKVEVDLPTTLLEEYRVGLQGNKGFDPDMLAKASSFCLQNNTNIEEGMVWAERAALFQKSFTTLSNLSQYYSLKGKQKQSDSLLTASLDMGTMLELHQYGKQLVGMKKNTQALEVFKFNAKKHPKEFTTIVGLARGYSANGDYKNALVNAKAALPLAPNDLNKQAVTGMIQKLENKTDIN